MRVSNKRCFHLLEKLFVFLSCFCCGQVSAVCVVEVLSFIFCWHYHAGRGLDEVCVCVCVGEGERLTRNMPRNERVFILSYSLAGAVMLSA